MNRRLAYLVLGILLLVGAAFFALGTAVFLVPGVTTGNATSNAGYAAFSGACTAALAIPAVLFLYFYRQAAEREKGQQMLVMLLRTVQEAPVREIAEKIGRTPSETESLIAKAVAEGQVHGYIDRRAGKWVATAVETPAPGPVPQVIIQPPSAPAYAPSATTGPPETRYCRECGSLIERVPGQTFWKCTYCGNVQ